MTTLFISDLHLQEERPEITQAFFQFLNKIASKARQLYILGDFFEVWIGDDALTPFHMEIINALKGLSASCELFFLHGNRDFLIGSTFAKMAGATLLADPTTISINGSQALIMHGDSLCTSDEDYISFRAMVRDPRWQKAFLEKPVSERLSIARHLRTTSKQQTSNKSEYITDVTPSEVKKVMQAHECPTLIHGHTHRPDTHQVTLASQTGNRIVLGDWGETGWYISATPQGIELLEFKPG